MMSARLSSELDRFRWIAALMVVVSHLRNLLFVDYGELAGKGLAVKLLYFITGFGHEAVVVFFVISGLLVGGTALDKARHGRFDAADFIVHRFSRIYIVLVPALLACLLLDRIGLAHFDAAHLYSRAMPANFHRVFADNLGWSSVLGNLAMLQHIRIDVLGSNAPLWSLSYEWWYYTLFFLAVGGVLAARNPALRLLALLAIVLILAWLPAEPALWFSLWLLGVAAAFVPLQWLRVPPLAAYALLFAALAWSRFDHSHATTDLWINFRRDAIVAAGCFVLFAALRHSTRGEIRGARFHRAMAGFSYTVYLVHVPFLVFGTALLDTLFGIPFYRQPSARGMLHFGVLLLVIYAYCFVFSLLTERHTGRLRRWLHRLRHAAIARRTAVAAPAAVNSLSADE